MAATDEGRHIQATGQDSASVHPVLVRVTHWLLVMSFVCLVASGIAILIAHPRLYWGETGNLNMPALMELPLPTIYGHSGWGRYLHFLAAWLCVLSGLTFIIGGLISGHIRHRLLPARTDMTWRAIAMVIRDHLHWRRPPEAIQWRYNVVQRLTYLLVIFVLFPGMVWTGLAMSPTITAGYPFFVTLLGGHQSARTLHFFIADLLVVFLIVHLVMLVLVGFRSHVRAMVTGRQPAGESS